MLRLPPQCTPHHDEVLSVQVPGCYLKAGRGYQPDSAHVGSPGQSPLSFSNSRRLPTAPFRTSPLQPSQNPARPSAEQPADAADSASAAGQLSDVPSQGDAAAEGKGQADVDQEAQHVSFNGIQRGEDLGLSGLSLQDAGDGPTQHLGQQSDETDGGHLSTGRHRRRVATSSHSEQRSARARAAELNQSIMKRLQWQQA